MIGIAAKASDLYSLWFEASIDGSVSHSSVSVLEVLAHVALHGSIP